jgi:hypothetical protein
MIRITSKQDGFRRCGVAHPKEATEYGDKAFTPEQLKLLQAEPMLTVTIIAESKPLTAADLIAQIKAAATVAEVDALLGSDERKTVVDAAAARKAELVKE